MIVLYIYDYLSNKRHEHITQLFCNLNKLNYIFYFQLLLAFFFGSKYDLILFIKQNHILNSNAILIFPFVCVFFLLLISYRLIDKEERGGERKNRDAIIW